MAKMRPGTRKNRTTANLYRYVIDHDMGFSPNPFHGTCTLANCKPEIRRTAIIGDFVLGFGSAASGIRSKLIYWLRVDEFTTYDKYWLDPRFQNKKPVVNGSHLKFHGDNIYHHDGDGFLIQEPSFHSLPDGSANPKNVKTDTSRTNRVIISNTYGYYGKEAISIPTEFAPAIPIGRGHRVAIDRTIQDNVVSWLLARNERGFIGEPSGWKKIKT